VIVEDLVRWLSTQLDAEEAAARAARQDGGDCWELIAHERGDGAIYDDMGNPVLEYDTDPESGLPTRHDLNPLGARQAAFIARHDPARVLREIDAKRRMLIRCEEEMLSGIPRLVHFAKQTVREMALPYADRPGYKEDWP
jgi:hypothetical protein